MSTATVTITTGALHEPAAFTTFSLPDKHDISTELQYVKLSAAGEALGPSTWGKTEFEEDREELVPVLIQDIRGKENQYALDTHGFQLVRHQTCLSKDAFADGNNIVDIYYPETAEVVKRVTNAAHVHVIHHVLRHSTTPDADSLGVTRPLYKVHVDSTPTRVESTIRMFERENADALLKKRYALINVWRPLKRCFKDPLAYCDGSTVPEKDFVARELVMPKGESNKANTAVAKNSSHKWHYLHGMEADEIVLVKCWDQKEGVVKRCPHSAVRDPIMEDKEDRESVEVRCLVFWD
ncbi:hypothetical protein HD806DRAFT_235059 [Xylariaceae sp. AK1471]|nr:hypothetical protein HD806DRAFT_235059 [Xylariaceae sp. AK1471]